MSEREGGPQQSPSSQLHPQLLFTSLHLPLPKVVPVPAQDNPHRKPRVVRVNPAEVEIVTDMARARHETWQVIGDDSIEPGGCLLRGVDSFADNTLTHRFEQVVAQFRAYRDIPVEDTAGKEQ